MSDSDDDAVPTDTPGGEAPPETSATPGEAEDAPAAASSREPVSEQLPLVPLRDNVVFPGQVAPLAAGRPRSVGALERAVREDNRVVLAVQRHPEVDDVDLDDVHPVAVVATVGALRRLGAGGAQALVEGVHRVRIDSLDTVGDAWIATVTEIAEPAPEGAEIEALVGSVKELFGDYLSAGGPLGPDIAVAMSRATEPARVADIAATAPDIALPDRVALLQESDPEARLRSLVPALARLVEVAQLRSKITEDVQRTIGKTQREHILREQLRAVRKELTELEGGAEEEEDLLERIETMDMPEEVRARVRKEVARLEQIPSASPEMGVVRSWLDLVLELPWGEPAEENIDIALTAAILDEDHFGLTRVKERILEWLAVRDRLRSRLEQAAQRRQEEARATSAEESGEPAEQATEKAPETSPAARAGDESRRALRTPILCLVGPPGVGKTSLGRSIARALDRKFVRLSLGGIRDEAEIRGHRRTYIGALPGRIIQSMRRAGTRNPVIMLDEIDKVGMDFRGDPSSALLEVLDPEQNWEFSDHYLEVPYDLSHVLFITTANIAETISPPLRDRMELIHINGYTEQEKLGIAGKHLIPHQLEQHGLDSGELEITDEALVAILHGYTREAGVRQLDRTIAQIARKVPRRLAEGEEHVVVAPDDLTDLLGPQRFDYGETQDEDEVGAVTGVVVSEVGGDIATVEALPIPGKTELVLTGQLGSVMEESARAALSWAKVHAHEYGAPRDFFDTHGIHIHVPAGAIPKDGPSAGVTMTTALISAATGRRVRRDVAMTGEVTLRGRVLPIGGVKDKLLAAHRSGLTTFVLPRKNMRDLHEVDREILDAIKVVPVDNVAEVLEVALLPAEPVAKRRPAGFVFPFPETGGTGIPTA